MTRRAGTSGMTARLPCGHQRHERTVRMFEFRRRRHPDRPFVALMATGSLAVVPLVPALLVIPADRIFVGERTA